MTACATAAAALEVRIDMVERQVVPPPILSNLIAPPEDLALAGARLGLSDIAATGRFMGDDFTLTETRIAPGEDLRPAIEALLADGARLILVKAPAEDMLALADLAAAEGAVIFNVSDPSEALRGADCRANVLHTTPSLAMRTDALAQFALKKRWTRLALLQGPNPEDAAFADALRASLTKFGLSLAAEKAWAFDADMRRVASEELPAFTQDLPDHDLLLVADERGDFGRYIPYNTWVPRPVAGSEGIMPLGFSGVVENWGAAQLQTRFRDLSGREMQATDFAAWAAAAAIGEAVTRTRSADPDVLHDYLLSDGFRLAGFLGTPLSFRAWDGQMRQPIPLVTERAVVVTAPLEGFLHEFSELDTLGQDRPGTSCTAFP
ncbi:branched-chain amino acid ABC transporter substrate-binding protein [Paracoccus aestuarii]|uniref:Branched-chain amino acid ABC transporter substrate-binding protein n=2 Tax=Paracoccus aestuarii TaxID=453842 RepID=A0A418ZZ74_9RHOB|nr:branched-chain amino acid ABC transporter substrate-binding protein [Paracoccus aestuarii]